MTPAAKSSMRKRFFGHGIPYTDATGLEGALITIEGTDGVGRSTQVASLKQWLEVQGYGVIETGWTRSELMSETILAAKAGHSLNRLTFSLMYATDFADRLEKIVIPALRSGFVVLADRYVFTAFARSVVRGADPQWIRNVFGFALVPDMTLYLQIDADALLPRILHARKIDFWEAGMDMHLGTDLYESARRYQWRLIREYNRMARQYGFISVDATLAPDEIQARIRRKVSALLEERRLQTLTDNLESLRPLLFEETAPAVAREAARDVARDVSREAEAAKTGPDAADPKSDREPAVDAPTVDPERTRSTAPSDS